MNDIYIYYLTLHLANCTEWAASADVDQTLALFDVYYRQVYYIVVVILQFIAMLYYTLDGENLWSINSKWNPTYGTIKLCNFNPWQSVSHVLLLAVV